MNDYYMHFFSIFCSRRAVIYSLMALRDNVLECREMQMQKEEGELSEILLIGILLIKSKKMSILKRESLQNLGCL